MIEVEVKARVTDFKDIEDKLILMNAQMMGSEHQVDVYFNAPHRDFTRTDEALRIRKVTRSEGSETILTYKGAKLDESSKTREEIEVNLSDADNTALILDRLGFKPVQPVEKKRITYIINEFNVTLDTVYRVGNFVEIEKTLLETEDYQDSINEIFNLYKELGVTEGFERRSYLELLELKMK